jgi:hypothetical protein
MYMYAYMRNFRKNVTIFFRSPLFRVSHMYEKRKCFLGCIFETLLEVIL